MEAEAENIDGIVDLDEVNGAGDAGLVENVDAGPNSGGQKVQNEGDKELAVQQAAWLHVIQD